MMNGKGKLLIMATPMLWKREFVYKCACVSDHEKKDVPTFTAVGNACFFFNSWQFFGKSFCWHASLLSNISRKIFKIWRDFKSSAFFSFGHSLWWHVLLKTWDICPICPIFDSDIPSYMFMSYVTVMCLYTSESMPHEKLWIYFWLISFYLSQYYLFYSS